MKHKLLIAISITLLLFYSCKNDEEKKFDMLSKAYVKYGPCYGNQRFQYFPGDSFEETIKRNNEFYNDKIENLKKYQNLALKLNKSIPDVQTDIKLLLDEKEDINSIDYLEGSHGYSDIKNTLFQLKNFKNKYPNTCNELFINSAIREYESWLNQFK